MTDRQMDNAIDTAIRSVMDVDTDPGFRARVLEELATPAPRTFGWLKFAAASAVVATLFAGFVLTRPATLAPGGPAVSSRQPTRTPPAAIAPQAAPAPVRLASQAPPRVSRLARARTSRAARVVPEEAVQAAVAPPELTTAIDPLNPIRPITVELLAPTPITSAAVVVAPLDPIAEVEISPLDSRNERD